MSSDICRIILTTVAVQQCNIGKRVMSKFLPYFSFPRLVNSICYPLMFLFSFTVFFYFSMLLFIIIHVKHTVPQ